MELSERITIGQYQRMLREGDVIMPERELQEAIRKACILNKWLMYHTHDSRRSQEGYPDVVAIRDKVLLIAELKSAQGKLTPAQQEWLDAFRGVTQVETYLWRPTDLPAALARLARRD